MIDCGFDSHSGYCPDPVVQRRRLLAHIQATMVRVHPGSLDDGLLVQGNDAGSARRKSGFNSPAVHCATGSWSKGDDTSPAGWESGFESRWVH